MTYEKFIEEYLKSGLLKLQKSDFQGVEKLILRADKELKTAQANIDIDEGVAYTVAYLAMLHTGRAFMLLKGFRSAGGYQHKTVVEFMAYLLGEKYKIITERFDKMRKKRNIFTYEVDVSISKTEANNALNTAKEFVNLIKDIIKQENPQAEFGF